MHGAVGRALSDLRFDAMDAAFSKQSLIGASMMSH
jgi:hypothetical protein